MAYDSEERNLGNMNNAERVKTCAIPLQFCANKDLHLEYNFVESLGLKFCLTTNTVCFLAVSAISKVWS